MNYASNELETETGLIEAWVQTIAFIMQFGSGLLAGATTWLYLSTQSDSTLFCLFFSTLVAGMTMGALFSFTAATVRLFPRLTGKRQALGAAAVVSGLIIFSVVSGTSNATFLAYGEAKTLSNQQFLAEAENGFQDAQKDAAQFAQIGSIVGAGRDVAAAMRKHEEQDGQTGSGRGPIYAELLSQATRLQAVDSDIAKYVADSQSAIRAGQNALEHIRAASKDPELDDDQRQRALENGLTRLATIVIQLRQDMPLASLRGMADMLTSPISLPSYSDDPATRSIQDETVSRLQSEFEPIGEALRAAVIDMEENPVEPVPVYIRQSPTAMVFAHAADLWFIIGVGYALDLLPFLAVTLIMLARKQVAAATDSGPHDRRELMPRDPAPAPRFRRGARRGARLADPISTGTRG